MAKCGCAWRYGKRISACSPEHAALGHRRVGPSRAKYKVVVRLKKMRKKRRYVRRKVAAKPAGTE